MIVYKNMEKLRVNRMIKKKLIKSFVFFLINN